MKTPVAAIVALACLLSVSDCAAESVPPPWSPVHVSGRQAEVWGRRYGFAAGILPVSIRTQGKELLASPPKLLCRVDGQAVKWDAATVTAASPTHATIAAEARAPRLLIQAEARVEYDGLLWVSLSLRPEQAVTVEQLDLDLPLRREVATLYTQQNVSTRNLDNWRSQRNAPERLYWAGALPAAGWRGEFTPQLWLGNGDVGLGWLCESPASWSVGDQDTVIEAVPDGDAVRLRVHFVTQPLSLAAPRTISFGLMPTPVRPPPTDRTLGRIASTGGIKVEQFRQTYLTPRADGKTGLDEVAAQGVKTLVLWNFWSDQWGFPNVFNPENQAFVREFVAAAHQRGLRVLPYTTPMTMLPDTLPDYEALRQRFHVHPKHSIERFGHRSYALELTDDAIAWYVGQMRDFLGKFDVDGFYVDTIQVPDPFNAGPRIRYDLLQRRKLYQRIYGLLHAEARKDGLVYMHCSDPPLLMAAPYADLHLTGEMQIALWAYRRLARTQHPFLEALPLIQFMAWDGNRVIGNLETWCWKDLSQDKYTVGADVDKAVYGRGQLLSDSEMVCLSRLFRWPVFAPTQQPGNKSTVALSRLQAEQWKLEDEFGIRDAQWFGCDQSATVLSITPATAFASLYLKPGKEALTHVANLGGEGAKVVIRFLPPSALVDKPLIVRRHVEGDKLEAGTGAVSVRLGGGSSTIVWVTGR